MLGYDISWVVFYIIEVMSLIKFIFKVSFLFKDYLICVLY